VITEWRAVFMASATLAVVNRASRACTTQALARSRGGWTYWRPGDDAVVEFATVWGREVALPAHFHDEHQFTFVLSGRRSFLIGDRPVVVPAGTGAWIPARVAHRSTAESSGVVCLNTYVAEGRYDVAALIRSVQGVWREHRRLSASDLSALATPHRVAAAAEATAPLIDVLRRHTSVAAAASEVGMSREGYSRLFTSRYGMPPRAYRRVMQLNAARQLLRAGEGIAATAAQSGFADQSHMGRWFRRVFGTTPGRYCAGSASSQPF
jgi:AraC-like DNA-binding protein/mannose-6-phosphate isomerase-like protein (cupin superfamily)